MPSEDRPSGSGGALPAVELRDASVRDLETLVRFNAAMARETEGLELDLERLRAGLRAALEDRDEPGRGAYRVAEVGGAAAGCLMITREWSDWRNGWFWWIQSVYVEAAHRRRGVLTALYRDALARARAEEDVCGVRLYVDRENQVAAGAYVRLGMVPSSYDMLEVDLVLER